MKTFITEDLISIGFDGIRKSFVKAFKSAVIRKKLSKTIKKDVVVGKMITKAELKHLYKAIKTSCGSFLEDVVSAEFKRIIKKYDKNGELYDLLFEDFWETLLKFIEKDYSDLYNQYMLHVISNQVTKLVEKDEKQFLKFEELLKDEKIKQISDINNELKCKSSKKLSLECFDLDDYSTESKLNEIISNNDTAYIKFYSPIEAFYRVLNFLHKKGCTNVLIIDKLDVWEKLKNLNVSNHILVITFPFDEIPIIESNCNLVFIDDSCSPVEHKVIELKKRTRTNIEKSLEKMGYTYEDIYKLLEQTHGLFVPLYSKICDNSIIRYKYDIDEKDLYLLANLLFVKSFSENDYELFASVFDIDKNLLTSSLCKYLKGENPLLYKNSKGMITFSAFEYAWNILSKSITQSVVDNAISLFNKIICSTIFYKERYLKNLIDSFCYCRYILGVADYSNTIICYLDSVLDEIKNAKNLKLIIKFIVELSDLIPDRVIATLDNFSDDKTYMSNVMKNIDNRCDILWALEKCVQIPSLTYKSLEVLCKLDTLNLNDYGNSAKNTLTDIFCPWFNLLPEVYKKSKVKFAKKLIKKYPNFWNIIFNNFPQRNQVIHGQLSSPKFLGEKIDNAVSIEQYRFDINSYFDVCLNECEKDVIKITNILEDIHYFGDEKISLFKSKLDSMLDEIPDYDKMLLKEGIREKIHKHRFFADADWAIGEEKLKIFINLLDEIKFSKREYDYHYLYSNYSEIPLLNPCQYQNENYHEINEKLIEEERTNGLVEFKKLGLDLGFLIEISSEETTILGSYIAKVYCDLKDNDSIINLVFSSKNFEIIRRFCLTYVNGNIDKLIALVTKYKEIFPIKYANLSTILSCYHNLDKRILDFVDQQEKEIQNQYYSLHALFFRDERNDPKLVKRVLDNTLKYKHLSNFIEYLYEGRLDLSSDEIFNYFKKMSTHLVNFKCGVMDDYYISEVSKLLINYIGTDFEKLSVMALIEEKYFERDDDKLLYLKNYISLYPQYVEDILSILYGKKEGNKTEAYTKLFYLRFCPGFYNGVFSKEIFDKWMNLFNEYCVENNIRDHSHIVLGKMFAFSAPDADGIIPVIPIRNFIEEEDNDDLNREFVVAVLNKRGVFTPDQGKSERRLANHFLEISNILKDKYPVCSRIYKWISDDYFGKSEYERKIDEI